MFIIYNAFKRQANTDSIQKRISKGIKEVGPSITAATICEFSAFLSKVLRSVGAIFTKIPALTQFCYLAAFAVLIDYIFQLTTFVSLLSWIQEGYDQTKVDKINYKITTFI
jgi:hypothetical protein